MEPELKHIAPYLPYGLKCQLVDQGKTTIAALCGAYTDNSYGFFDTVESEHGFDSIKPVLRPLIDLTKEIEHNGEKFEPLDELLKLSCFDISKMNKQEKEEYTEVFTSIETGASYMDIQKLFEWHFDVFELIDKGIAIDFNSLCD